MHKCLPLADIQVTLRTYLPDMNAILAQISAFLSSLIRNGNKYAQFYALLPEKNQRNFSLSAICTPKIWRLLRKNYVIISRQIFPSEVKKLSLVYTA